MKFRNDVGLTSRERVGRVIPMVIIPLGSQLAQQQQAFVYLDDTTYTRTKKRASSEVRAFCRFEKN